MRPFIFLMKDSSPSGAFCFFTLFNLQGARRFPATIRYYIRSESICQALFHDFLKFFFKFPLQRGFARPLGQELLNYITALAHCQDLFSFFSKLFCPNLFEPRRSLAGDLLILADSSPIVNTFFLVFLTFFRFLQTPQIHVAPRSPAHQI